MATRARIGLELTDGSVITSYHHWDGYPAGLGFNLISHWDNPQILLAAIRLGDASHWGKRIAADGLHSFESPEENVNVYYGRDRGESNVDALAYDSYAVFEKSFLRNTPCGEEYAYVLRRDGTWTMIQVYTNTVTHDAEDDIILARADMIRMMRKEVA